MSEAGTTIVIVEDEPQIAELLRDYLHGSGFKAEIVGDGLRAVDTIRATQPVLVLLDLMLPGKDGLAICREVREFSAVPIIMVTARVEEIDRLLGLEIGADDYICKPFSPREVVARVRAHLRRAAPAVAAALTVDRSALRISHGAAALPLTPVEFRILSELIDHPGRVYSRQQLLDLAHEDQRDVNDRTVDSHVKNIRRKLAASPALAECLQSVYGVGYRFDPPL